MLMLLDGNATLGTGNIRRVENPLRLGYAALSLEIAREFDGVPDFLAAGDARVEEGEAFAVEEGACPGRGVAEVGGGAVRDGGGGAEGFVGSAGGVAVAGGAVELVDAARSGVVVGGDGGAGESGARRRIIMVVVICWAGVGATHTRSYSGNIQAACRVCVCVCGICRCVT